MLRLSLRLLAVVGAVLATGNAASAQLIFNYNFNTASGFSGSVANPTYYSTDNRDTAIIRAGDYIRTQIDARGTVNVHLGTQTNAQIGSGTLAVGGTNFFVNNGFKTNGITFLQATTADSGQTTNTLIDFNSDQTNWFTGSGSSAGSGRFDIQSVALHEITHSMGFLSLINETNGWGLGGSGGITGTYSQLDGSLREGSAANAIAFLTPNQGSVEFNFAGGATVAALSGNQVYHHGEFTKAANLGNAVRMAGGGDLSHLHSSATNAVMLPGIGLNTDRRAYTNVDLAMLIDMGWNQFVWKNTDGFFADNVSSLSNARWQNLDEYDVLSPVGTITTNAVLRFGGTGGYTATNNLNLGAANRHLVTRVILNATAGTSNIAATGSNAFRFDSTIGVAPQIRQDGAGAFNISHPLELTGRNLELAGNGAGLVTLSGTIGQQSGQTGSIIKSGTSTFALGGNNTYTGGTTVNGGTLLVTNTAGSGTGTGAVAVNSGGTLGGTGTIAGATTVNAGGTIRGDSGTGTGTLNLANTTILGAAGSTGGTLAARLAVNGGGTITGNSKLALGSNTLNLVSTGGKFNIELLDDGALTSGQAYTIILATGGLTSFQRNGVIWNATLNPYTAADYTVTSGSGAWTFNNTILGVDGSNNLTLQFTPVPEPGTVLAVAGAGLLVLGGIRRRFRVTSPALSA